MIDILKLWYAIATPHEYIRKPWLGPIRVQPESLMPET